MSFLLIISIVHALNTHSSKQDVLLNSKSSFGKSYLTSKKTSYQIDLLNVRLNISDLQKTVGDISSCSSSHYCQSCVLNSGCVWCPSENQCVDGNPNGPFGQTCAEFQHAICLIPDCDAYQFCFECIQNNECGWCENSKTCYEGNSVQPGNCAVEEYYHGNSGNSICVYDEAAEAEQKNNEIKVGIARLKENEEELENMIALIDSWLIGNN